VPCGRLMRNTGDRCQRHRSVDLGPGCPRRARVRTHASSRVGTRQRSRWADGESAPRRLGKGQAEGSIHIRRTGDAQPQAATSRPGTGPADQGVRAVSPASV